MFGTPAGSAPAFSFATTPATPAASSGTALFGAGAGAAPSGSLFGASPVLSATTPSLFGAPAASTAPAFGMPAASTSLFGQAASKPMFGAMPAASAAAPPSIFGGTSTPSLFGATPGAFGSATAGGFGSSQPQQQTSLFGSGFASQQPQQQQQLATLQMASTADAAAVRELEALRDAFTGGPGNRRYRFACLLLNVVDDPAARQKPEGVDELVWREALQKAGGPNNPDRLWPVLASGMSSLRAREEAQASAVEEHRARLAAAATAVRDLAQRREDLLTGRLETARRREAQLGQQLLRVSRHIDALEGRFAAAMGHRPPAARSNAADIGKRLTNLEKALHPSAAAGLPRRIEKAAVATEDQLDRVASGRAQDDDGGGATEIDPKSLQQLLSLLKQQQKSLSALEDVLQIDNRDLAIMLDENTDAVPKTVTQV